MTITNDLQQASAGFNTVAIIPGPVTVRVLEAQDVILQHTKHRYFISVDFKFRQSDALNIGKSGWLGLTKAEATREANALASKAATIHAAWTAAKELALNYDTFTNRYTAKRQGEAFDKLVGRYNTEIL